MDKPWDLSMHAEQGESVPSDQNLESAVCADAGTSNSSLKTNCETEEHFVSTSDALSKCGTIKSQKRTVLSELDDDILIKILSVLDLKSRFAASMTCTKLKELSLSTHCLWRSLTLNTYSKSPRCMELTENEKSALASSCGNLRKATIVVDKDFNPGVKFTDEKTLEVGLLIDAFRTSNLDCLQIVPKYPVRCTYNIRNLFELLERPQLSSASYSYIDSLLEIGLKSKNLKRLDITTMLWRSKGDNDVSQLLDTLNSSPVLRQLKIFSFDCTNDLISNSFSQRMYDHNQFLVTEMMGKLENLQELNIHSMYITDDLIKGLSQSHHVSLQSMTIFAVSLPRKVEAWPQLLKHSPHLKVKVHCVKRCIFEPLTEIIPSYVPVVEWHFLTAVARRGPCQCMYCKLGLKLEMLQVYANTLEKLYFLYHIVDDERSEYYSIRSNSNWLDVVRQCSKLDTLVYPGQICSSDILSFAALPRKWLRLSFLDRNLISSRTLERLIERDMDRFCDDVSERLGYKWKLSSFEDFIVFNKSVKMEREFMRVDVESADYV